MEVKELGHLVLYVRDIEASAHFYRDILGWRPIPMGEAMRGIEMRTIPEGERLSTRGW